MRISILILFVVLIFSGCVDQNSQDESGQVMEESTQKKSNVLTNAMQEEAASSNSKIMGKTAPDFTLMNGRGEEISLSDFRGQWVVLYFYPKDDTPGCTIEANDFTSLERNFKQYKSTVIGISADSVESHNEFSEKFNLKVELLSDPNYQVMRSYGAWVDASFGDQQYGRVIRSTFLIDAEGVIQYHWPEVIPDGHAERVLQKLEELQKK